MKASRGPGQVIAIVNGGDSEIVGRNLEDLAASIFRADNAVELMVHEERARRGQFLGLLDAVRQWRREGRTFDSNGVALGIMLPGKGTRLSPITQRLHGIKPFMPVFVRQGRDGHWLNTAAASLYTWTLLAHHLQRMGFRGIAWKWGDEPQIAAHRLAEVNLDLSRTDAVRFGAEVEVTEDLAANKEWLLRHPTSGDLIVQVQRRSRAELLQRFDIVDRGQRVKALVHIGSPAFSFPFLEEAEALFGGLDGWIDVDGYLFEALTHDADAWQAELNRDAGLQQLVTERPDFWQRVQQLKRRVEERRGHPLNIKVVDFGEHLYWGDIGQLAKARRALWAVAAPTVEGNFARCLAAIDHVAPDPFGNRIVGDSTLPSDGHVRNSVVIDTWINGRVDMEGAVLVASELGDVMIRGGGVAFGCTVDDLDLGKEGLAFMSIQQSLKVPAHHVHTSIPSTPAIYLKASRTGSPIPGKTLAGARTTPSSSTVIPTPLLPSFSRCASGKFRPTRSSGVLMSVSASQSGEYCLNGRYDTLREVVDPLKILTASVVAMGLAPIPGMCGILLPSPVARSSRDRVLYWRPGGLFSRVPQRRQYYWYRSRGELHHTMECVVAVPNRPNTHGMGETRGRSKDRK